MNRRKIIAIIILIVILGFIWGHSMAEAEESQNESNLEESSDRSWNCLWEKGNVTDHLVRKLAHFTEYAARGLALGNAAKAFGKTKFLSCAVFFLCGMAAAFIDEGIQLFPPEDPRSSAMLCWIPPACLQV